MFVTLPCWVMLLVHDRLLNWLLCKCSGGSEPWGCRDKCISINHMFATSLFPFSFSESFLCNACNMQIHCRAWNYVCTCRTRIPELERVFLWICDRGKFSQWHLHFQTSPRWKMQNKIMAVSLLSSAEEPGMVSQIIYRFPQLNLYESHCLVPAGPSRISQRRGITERWRVHLHS